MARATGQGPVGTRRRTGRRDLVVGAALALSLTLAAPISGMVDGPSQTGPAGAHAEGRASGKLVRAKSETTIYWAASAVRPRRAIVEAGGVVEVTDAQPKTGSGCRTGWAAVAGGGYLCQDSVEPTAEKVRRVPPLLDGLLPFVFVHRLETKAYSYAFLPGEGAQEGELYRRGKPLDRSRYALHEPSRFQGRNLQQRPVRDGNLVPGWIVADATPLYRAPSAAEAPVRRLARHTPLLVARRAPAKGWREVRDEAGRRVLGFVKDDGKLRHWVAASPVSGLAEGENWIDIDVGQQMVALRSYGAGPIYVTLISSGLPERSTPLGVFRLEHKLAYRSMGNLPGSADQYFIENIPWAMYFLPYYAIHGAYWHDEFGNRRSHGCVNLAPRDALYIYERVPPWQQLGFFKTFASERAPGAVVRVRDSARILSGNDKRKTSGDAHG